MDLFKATIKGKQAASSTPDVSPFLNSTLVLPIVSLGNVSQLAADLLIHSLELHSVGCLSGKYHIPLVAPHDYVDSASSEGETYRTAGFSTAVEVFQSKDATLTLVQQRSPVIKSRKDAFVKALADFIGAAGFKRVLLLAGMDAGLMQHYDEPSPFRFLSSSDSSLKSNLEGIMRPLSPSTSSIGSGLPSIPIIPSSGITRRLLTSLMASSITLDIAAVTMFVAEGDNRYDAHVFARCVDRVLGLQTEEKRWREPMSWKVGLYGNELGAGGEEGAAGPAELYG